MSRLKFSRGFTLIELIVVIAILAILSVTSFIVLSTWFLKARNSRRLVDIEDIKGALESYYYTKRALNASWYQYPLPGKFVPIYDTTWNLLGLEWIFNEEVTSQMKDVLKAPKDPLDKNYYGYSIYRYPAVYEIVAFFEVPPEVAAVSRAYAAFEIQNRYPMVVDNIFDPQDVKIRPLSFVYASTGMVTMDLLGDWGAIGVDVTSVHIRELNGKKIGWVVMNQGIFKIPTSVNVSWDKVDSLDLTQLKSVGEFVTEDDDGH